MNSYEKWSLIVTIVGVAVGIGVLVVYGLQLQAMRESVEAAKRSSDALLNIERGWLLLENITPNLTDAVGHSAEFRVVAVSFINHGKSSVWVTQSGFDFAVISILRKDDSPLLEEPTPHDIPDGIRVAPGKDIFAFYTGSRTGGPMLTPEEVYPLSDEKANLFVRGFITYRDIFGTTTIRESHFHAELRPRQPWRQIGPEGSNRNT